MPRKSINFELDFIIKDIFPRFTVKQFDDVTFDIKPKNQGLDYDITGMTGKIFVGVNNDVFMQIDGITISSNNINVLLDKNILQKKGRAYAEIELTDSDGTISSSSFIFDIAPKIGEGGQIPGEVEGFVEKYERLISEFKTQVDSCTQNANTLVNETIERCNTNVDNKLDSVDELIDTEITSLEERFSTLTASQQQDAEVIDARDGEVSLATRLNRDIENAQQIFVDIEGSVINTDSSNGYLKDVEILGNTYQNAEDLADIRSVGDKVEGQELYEIPVVSCGKNLCISRVYQDVEDTVYVKVKIRKNCTYIISTSLGIGGGHITLNTVPTYNDYKQLISDFGQNNYTFTSNLSDGEYYLVFWKSGLLSNLNDTIQLEEGTVATPYEPYQEDKLNILSPTLLEKVGDVADRIICKDGVWGVEKNVETIVLDGSESWYKTGFDGGNTLLFYTIFNAKPCAADTVNLCISDKLPSSDITLTNNDVEGSYTAYDGNICIRINKSKLSTQDVAGFKSWLQTNPTLVKYQTETTTFIPLPHDQQIKLRTFAGQTNIHFETEIEPTIKAQVPKSIGASINTNSQQIANLSNELTRVKKLEESTVSTVETESAFTTVTETSNGYFEDVKLEGKTLVNLCPNSFNVEYTASASYDGYKGLGQSFATESIANGGYVLQDLKPSTVYTLAFNVVSLGDNGSFYINNYDASVCAIQDKISITKTNNIGLNILKVTTVEDISSKPVVLRCQNSSMTGLVHIKDFILLEGDHTQNPPEYFEGLLSAGQDVEEVSVESVDNGNLLHNDNFVLGNIIDSGVFIIANDTIVDDEFYSIIPNVDYTFKSYGQINNQAVVVNRIALYDKDYNFLSRVSVSMTSEVTFNITDIKAKYAKFIYRNPTLTNIDLTQFKDSIKLQLNIGDVVKNFVKGKSNKKPLLYYNPTTQTWEKPILREWDSIEKHSDGKYYYHKRSEEVVLNGSEYWEHGTKQSDTHTTLLYTNISERLVNSNGICDKFTTISSYLAGNPEGVFWGSDVNFRVSNSKLSTQDVEGFKAWLQANPTTVVYQLAQEEVYECTSLDLITYENETNYIVSSGVISPISTLKVHNNISNVVSILQEKVSLLETKFTEMFKFMLSGDYQSLAFSLYPSDFATTDATNELEELDESEE